MSYSLDIYVNTWDLGSQNKKNNQGYKHYKITLRSQGALMYDLITLANSKMLFVVYEPILDLVLAFVYPVKLLSYCHFFFSNYFSH